MSFVIFTDGACLGNPGPGGWGAIIKHPSGSVLELGGGFEETTNNRMELLAIIESLKTLGSEPHLVKVYSDSSYSLNGIQKWRHGWKKKGWVNSSKKPVANVELWKELDSLMDQLSLDQGFRFEWIHVPGHMGIEGNERADQIASAYAEKEPPKLYSGSFESYGVDLDPKLEDIAALSREKSSLKKTSKPHSGSASKSASTKKGKAFGYVSYVDGVFSFDKAWKQCEARVSGRSGVLYRKVFSEDEVTMYKEKWSR